MIKTATSPKVQYAYNYAPSGSTNFSQLTSMTYPTTTKVVNYTYDGFSRVATISVGATEVENYAYLGLGTVVKRGHATPGADMTYIVQGVEALGEAGDQYAGLDRFGRVVDQRWLKTGTLANLDRYQYTYDRDSNRTAKNNLVNALFNETYGYDGLNQLTSFSVNGTNKSWNYDAVGNWDSVTSGSTLNRTHNKQNEIVSADGVTNPPTYDANGNQTKDFTGLTYTYDAWNRVITTSGASGRTYEYDGLGRRIQQAVGATTTNYFQDASWQTLEDRTGSTVASQYVWSAGYVDEMVVRDLSGVRLWVTQDANYNVTGLLSNTGVVQERYTFDPYGSRTIYDQNYNVRATSSFSWVFGHQGLRLDTVTLKYYARNRDYDPVEGRWMTLDPMGFGAGDVNWYRFVNNEPTSRTDSSGLTEYSDYYYNDWVHGPSAGIGGQSGYLRREEKITFSVLDDLREGTAGRYSTHVNRNGTGHGATHLVDEVMSTVDLDNFKDGNAMSNLGAGQPPPKWDSFGLFPPIPPGRAKGTVVLSASDLFPATYTFTIAWDIVAYGSGAVVQPGSRSLVMSKIYEMENDAPVLANYVYNKERDYGTAPSLTPVTHHKHGQFTVTVQSKGCTDGPFELATFVPKIDLVAGERSHGISVGTIKLVSFTRV